MTGLTQRGSGASKSRCTRPLMMRQQSEDPTSIDPFWVLVHTSSKEGESTAWTWIADMRSQAKPIIHPLHGLSPVLAFCVSLTRFGHIAHSWIFSPNKLTFEGFLGYGKFENMISLSKHYSSHVSMAQNHFLTLVPVPPSRERCEAATSQKLYPGNWEILER